MEPSRKRHGLGSSLVAVLAVYALLKAATGRDLFDLLPAVLISPILLLVLALNIRWIFVPVRRSGAISHVAAFTLLIGLSIALTTVGTGRRYDIGDDIRWLYSSARYERLIMSEPANDPHGLDPNPRHAIWELWGGMGGGDEEADIVFAKDGISSAVGRGDGGIVVYGCPVARVHRLEPHWYIVTLYRDEGWPGC